MTAIDPDPVSDGRRMAALVEGILKDAGQLVRQQASMLRAEIRADCQRAATAAKYLGAGLALAGVGFLFFAVSAVYGLLSFLPAWPLWAGWATVGGLFLCGSLIAFLIGRAALKSVQAFPNKTLAALEENVTWITNPRN